MRIYTVISAILIAINFGVAVEFIHYTNMNNSNDMGVAILY